MQPGDTFLDWEKVDLHRHLAGSLRLSTLREIAREHDLLEADEVGELASLVRVDEHDPHRPDFFSSRFDTLYKYFLDQVSIERFARELIEDAAADNVRYLELRLAPEAIASQGSFPLEAVCEWVISSANAEAEARAVEVRYLLSFTGHEPAAIAQAITDLAVSLRPKGVVGLDLAGYQRHPASSSFAGMLQAAREHSLGIAVHAGALEMRQLATAIRDLGAMRIAHGLTILDDADLLREAREAEVCFEVSLTGDLRTGQIHDLASHPLPGMLEAGLQVALTTGDPTVFNTTLSDEFRLAMEMLDLSQETLKGLTLSSLQSGFLDQKSKRSLEEQFVANFWGGEGKT
jgi:adenosine deaminase